jgi:hypothetical protein
MDATVTVTFPNHKKHYINIKTKTVLAFKWIYFKSANRCATILKKSISKKRELPYRSENASVLYKAHVNLDSLLYFNLRAEKVKNQIKK